MSARTRGLDLLKAKLAALPLAVRDAAHEANQQNAREFMNQVAQIVPFDGDDDRHEHLVSTLAEGPGRTETAVKVSIGDTEAPFPAALEFGHMAKNWGGQGEHHVPAKPFWFPTLRLGRQRWRNRTSRAASAAMKKVAAGGQ